MASESSPLSYQTTMPEYPDVSYEGYRKAYNWPDSWNRPGIAIDAWLNGMPDYNTWRTNRLDEYNAAMSAYNTWLSTGEGMRRSAESGNYNPSYFQAGQASASPLDYQSVPDESGFSQMAQGISGIFQFAQAFASMRMLSEQVAGQKLKNEAQAITNRYLDTKLSLGNDLLSFNADRKQFDLEDLLYPRWSKRPELWKGGVFSPYGRGTYNLENVDQGFGYQRSVKDLDFLQAGIDLRKSQDDLTKASKREKQWFYDNVYSIQKSILEHTRDILKGTYDFQKTEQNLRKAGIIAGIGVNVINAAVNAIKAFVPGIKIGSDGSTTVSGGSKSPFIDPFDMVDMYGAGF